MLVGDSKTNETTPMTNTWPATLAASLPPKLAMPYQRDNQGVGGKKATDWLATWTAGDQAQAAAENIQYVICNLGVNDAIAGTSQADFENGYLAIIDAIQTKTPAPIYLMYPWGRNYDAACASIHTWIDNVIGARAGVYAGPDEAVWVKGADNGATMTSDGVHYSAAGEAECAAQWKTALGY